ncbi:hypothetical protein HIM_08328 [Hirsutella minnesotensis 3608]|uniref:Oxidoreductase DltE n=1 Tax=Hirsutella minnesotensis 3608 TaxID=1043627 RepID=A0A0F7ZYD6_9HYPO|nr:hypothetical protein HIM_08328 [Hirsutella minnesotensis 3608]
MSYPYKCVVVVGATAGIGAAMADRFVHEGAKVVAVGRRQDRLDSFVEKHGSAKASAIRYDVTDRAGMNAFVNGVMTEYPQVDCILLNSGIQAPHALSNPEKVDLDVFHREIDTNFSSIVNLSMTFLPHLLKKQTPTALMVTGTHLSLIPAVTLPAYSASKAALKAFFDCLRRQNHGTQVKFIEILPPMVQTELHDYMGEERGRALGMPVDEFVDQTFEQLSREKEEISIGAIGAVAREPYIALLETRRTMFETLSDVIQSR